MDKGGFRLMQVDTQGLMAPSWIHADVSIKSWEVPAHSCDCTIMQDVILSESILKTKRHPISWLSCSDFSGMISSDFWRYHHSFNLVVDGALVTSPDRVVGDVHVYDGKWDPCLQGLLGTW